VPRVQPRHLAALLLLLAGCGSEPQNPRIEAALPDHALPGQAVDLVGERFGAPGLEHVVGFGGSAAQVLLWQEQRIRVRVPQRSPGLTLVVVSVEGRPSNAVNFTVEGSAPDAGPRSEH